MYDLDAIVEAELGERPRTEFTCGGETFSLPATPDWPDAALEAMLGNDIVGMAKCLLGDQYAAYVAAGGNAMKLSLLVGKLAEKQGATLPESSASTGS